MGLFTTFVDASRAYSAVLREEIEPLRIEMRDWLRQRDRAVLPQRVTGTLETDETALPDTLVTPAARRSSPWLHPPGEAL